MENLEGKLMGSYQQGTMEMFNRTWNCKENLGGQLTKVCSIYTQKEIKEK